MRSSSLLPARALSLSALSLSKWLNGLLLVVLLALTDRTAFADGAPPQITYRRPVQLQQTIEPTALAHLEATQRALKVALAQLDNLHRQLTDTRNPDRNQGAVLYGGHFARAKDDMTAAIAAVTEASAFVRANPTLNPLAAGPAPADEPVLPPLPKLPGGTVINATSLQQAVDALNAALEAMVNNPARDYHGPVLGDLGGHRAKILSAIGRAGTALGNGIAYNLAMHGGSTGIVTIKGRTTDTPSIQGGSAGIVLISASSPVTTDPQYGPTARMHLAEARFILEGLNGTIAGTAMPTAIGNRLASDRTQGGHRTKVAADLSRALANIAEATAYLANHPEADRLLSGPAGPEPSPVRRVTVPQPVSEGRRGGANPLSLATVSSLNTALGWLLNPPDRNYRGPVLGDLGGYRAKIMEDLGQALDHTLAGVAYTGIAIIPGYSSPAQ